MKIEGYFSRIKNANDAVSKLKSEGINKAFVDINEHYVNDMNADINMVGSDNAPSQSDLVLRSGDLSEHSMTSPLLAASPMVSGFGKFEEVCDTNYKVVVETDDKNEMQAKQIIKDLGGEFISPNLDLPRRIKDMSLDKIDVGDMRL